jgi:hypothetical protein
LLRLSGEEEGEEEEEDWWLLDQVATLSHLVKIGNLLRTRIVEEWYRLMMMKLGIRRLDATKSHLVKTQIGLWSDFALRNQSESKIVHHIVCVRPNFFF